MNRKFIIGAVVCACLGAAAPAGAVTVPLSFDHVVLATPGTGKQQIVSDKTQPLKVNADVDPTTGNFTVQPSDFSIPTYSFSSPAPGTVQVSLKNPATGNVNFASGALTMNADLLATINVPGIGNCTKDTGPITLSTATTQPLPGQNFPAGPTGVATGNGAFGYGWSTLAPGTGSCSTIDSVVDGPGGFWVSRGISPTPAVIAAKVATPKKAKAGSTSVIKVTVSNTGGDASAPVKACVTAPKPLSPRSACQTVKTIAGSASKALSFRVKTAKHKKGKYTLVAKVTGTGITPITKKVTLTVR